MKNLLDIMQIAVSESASRSSAEAAPEVSEDKVFGNTIFVNLDISRAQTLVSLIIM